MATRSVESGKLPINPNPILCCKFMVAAENIARIWPGRRELDPVDGMAGLAPERPDEFSDRCGTG
jgi:hypothetical protein